MNALDPAPRPAADFDRRYSEFHGRSGYRRRWSSEFDRRNSERLWQRIHATIVASGVVPERVLEIGCGSAASLVRIVPELRPAGLFGIDVRMSRLRSARRSKPDVNLCQSDCRPIPFRSGVFDLAFQLVTFSSIRDRELKRAIGAEIRRVLRPGGLFLWYDFRYPNPFNPHTTFESRERIRGYFGRVDLHLEPMTVIPSFGRMLHPRFEAVLRVLDRVPALRSHYFGWFVEPGARSA
jgi:ubiquinone/menaquinone biosynthesis C-methylase UbiE